MRSCIRTRLYGGKDMKKITILTPIRSTDFGIQCELDTPPGTGAVILCRNTGTGLDPFTLCLDHQVYIKKIEATMEDMNGASINEIVAIPIRSEEYIKVATKNAKWMTGVNVKKG